MKIALLPPLWKPVPPKGYGGTERIVSLLAETLVEKGHDVRLYASGDSVTKSTLIPVVKKSLYEQFGGFDSRVHPYDYVSFLHAVKDAKAGKVDIIHSHLSLEEHIALLAPLSPVPMVTTKHSSGEPYPLVAQAAKDSMFISISDSQRKLAPYLNYIATVHHGIDVTATPYSYKPGSYLLYIGGVYKVKGVDRAIAIAKRTGMRLIIAGIIHKQAEYDEIAPDIDGKQITYVGEVSPSQREELMQGAYAFIFAIRWAEAFGLVIIEALSAGTPVIAWNNGAIPELVDHGETGFVVDNLDAAVKAVGDVKNISRKHCRHVAEQRFDRHAMTQRYVDIYSSLV